MARETLVGASDYLDFPQADESVEGRLLFIAAKRISSIVLTEADKLRQRALREDSAAWIVMGNGVAHDDIDPLGHQSEQGLFLSYRNGIPESIWTPYGEHIIRGGIKRGREFNPQRLHEALLGKIDMTIHLVEGSIAYAVHRVEDLMLPEPKLRPKSHYVSQTGDWHKFSMRFNRGR